jgi:hypothetical protein
MLIRISTPPFLAEGGGSVWAQGVVNRGAPVGPIG